MLRNVTNIICPTAKPPHHTRLWSAGLATLALFITAFPSFAASPQPQPQTPQPPQPPQSPNAVCPSGGQCFADVSVSSPFYAFVNRIYQQDLVSGYACGGVGEPCDTFSRPYYRPVANVTRSQMAKFIDNARRLPQIYIEATSSDAPIYVSNTVGYGVYGSSSGSFGVFGVSNSSGGVHGISTSGIGVSGTSYGTGVFGGTSSSASDDYGVWGSASAPAQAGHFSGNVQITGNLSKGGGSFKIDHPLDPANKYLYHSFVESPDMMNVYNGNVTTDEKGEATIQLPDYFEQLNKDFRYQLTVMGQFAQAIVSQKIMGNRFTIKTDKPNVEVSWQVTGIRQDPYANAHRIPVEEEKQGDEKGKYLHPTEWGQPESKGVEYERLQQMK
jgi:hypothetical protein